ncbi:MAG: radical SAM protein [Candidatus Electronema sp. V4]|uniref:radical SAM protein n=1 Tax=Candidatus Electronema sp. V4 TaxID=3454756 RepID=UPI004055996D
MYNVIITKLRHYVMNGSLNPAFYTGLNILKFLRMRHLVVRVDTNWLCNLKCRMCHFSDPSLKTLPPMRIDLFQKIANDIFPKALWLYMSCRAEPFMTKNFGDFLKIASRYNVPHFGVMTNGQLLNEDRINELIDCNVKELGVSIDGATRETYEMIRINGKFERLLDNLALLNSIKKKRKSKYPLLRLNYVVMKENVNELVNFIDVVSPFEPDRINVRHIGTSEAGSAAWSFHDQSTKSGQSEFNRELRKFIEKAKEKKISIDVPTLFSENQEKRSIPQKNTPGCIYPWMMIFVHPDGTYRPCVDLPLEGMPNFNSQTYKEINASKIARQIRHDLMFNQQKSCLTVCKKRVSDNVTSSGELF